MTTKAFISAQRASLSDEQNAAAHRALGNDLTASILAGGIDGCREVRGVYNGVAEYSYLLEVENLTTDHVASFAEIARTFRQESILFVGPDRKACLLYTTGLDAGKLEWLSGEYQRIEPGFDPLNEPESYTIDGDAKFAVL